MCVCVCVCACLCVCVCVCDGVCVMVCVCEEGGGGFGGRSKLVSVYFGSGKMNREGNEAVHVMNIINC